MRFVLTPWDRRLEQVYARNPEGSSGRQRAVAIFERERAGASQAYVYHFFEMTEEREAFVAAREHYMALVMAARGGHLGVRTFIADFRQILLTQWGDQPWLIRRTPR